MSTVSPLMPIIAVVLSCTLIAIMGLLSYLAKRLLDSFMEMVTEVKEGLEKVKEMIASLKDIVHNLDKVVYTMDEKHNNNKNKLDVLAHQITQCQSVCSVFDREFLPELQWLKKNTGPLSKLIFENDYKNKGRRNE